MPPSGLTHHNISFDNLRLICRPRRALFSELFFENYSYMERMLVRIRQAGSLNAMAVPKHLHTAIVHCLQVTPTSLRVLSSRMAWDIGLALPGIV